jgi:2-iminobutanoate/2-iminopropanoate deaminase
MKRFNSTANLHRQVVANGFVFTAGVTADDKSGDIAAQTRNILQKIDGLLSEAGASRDSVVSATIYMAGLPGKTEFNTVWQAHFAPGQLPARAVVGVADLGENVLVEIAVVAAVA